MTGALTALARSLRKPDLLLAGAGFVYGLYQASRILPSRPLHPIVLAVLIASGAYLALQERLQAANFASPHIASRFVHNASDVIFSLSCAVALLTWHGALYVLPPEHYFALAVAAATILLDIVNGRTQRRGTAIVLAKIIILGLLARGAAYTLFPGPIGSDPWRHTLITRTLTETGHIPVVIPDAFESQNAYAAIPVFHLLTASLGQIAGVSTKAALFLSGSLTLVLSSVFIFLIGRGLLSSRAGLLAAMLYCVSDYAILWSVQVIAMTLASVFGACLLWLLLSGRPSSGASIALVMLFMVVLVLCHTVSAFVIFISLGAVAIGLVLLRAALGDKPGIGTTPLLNSSIVALYGTFMLIWWMTVPTSSGDSFFAVQADKLASVLATSTESQSTVSVAATSLPYFTTLQQHAGDALLIGLGLFAVLWSLRLARTNSRYLLVSIAVSALLTVQAIGSTSLQEAVIGARWVIFEYMLLAPLAAWVLLALTNMSRRRVPCDCCL